MSVRTKGWRCAKRYKHKARHQYRYEFRISSLSTLDGANIVTMKRKKP
jgi:hypothetical protein